MPSSPDTGIPLVTKPIESCTETTRHTHPESDAAGLWHDAEWQGWNAVEEYVILHEDPAQRRSFKKRFGDEPYLGALEEFAGQMRYLLEVTRRRSRTSSRTSTTEAAELRAALMHAERTERIETLWWRGVGVPWLAGRRESDQGCSSWAAAC